MIHTTLCYIMKGSQWLMLLRDKKANDINEGKWIGVGGKIQEGESPDQCIAREIQEETGLVADRVTYRGKICFYFENETEVTHVYTCKDFHGELHECDEGTLRWIDADKILSLRLWEGDRLFLGKLLDDDQRLFHLELTYDVDGNLTHVQESEETEE